MPGAWQAAVIGSWGVLCLVGAGMFRLGIGGAGGLEFGDLSKPSEIMTRRIF